MKTTLEQRDLWHCKGIDPCEVVSALAGHPSPNIPAGTADVLDKSGDEALIRQVAQAIEIQRRLQLGQLDEAQQEIERGMWSSLYGP